MASSLMELLPNSYPQPKAERGRVFRSSLTTYTSRIRHQVVDDIANLLTYESKQDDCIPSNAPHYYHPPTGRHRVRASSLCSHDIACMPRGWQNRYLAAECLAAAVTRVPKSRKQHNDKHPHPHCDGSCMYKTRLKQQQQRTTTSSSLLTKQTRAAQSSLEQTSTDTNQHMQQMLSDPSGSQHDIVSSLHALADVV